MSQAAIAPLNPATTSGTDLADILTDYEEAANTNHSGTTRPTYVQPGMLWLDTAATPWVMKFYDGVNDVPLYQVSASSSRLRSRAAEATVASASTTDVLGAATDFVAISGTATITSLGSEPLQIKYVRATGAFTLTHNATSLILPTGANIVAASGDTFLVTSDASGNARVLAYQRATGAALTEATAELASGTVALFFQTAAPTGWTKDTSNFNDHAIRIVTGTPSSGGSLNFSTVFGKSATDSFTLTTTHMPAHTHTGPSHSHGAGTFAVGTTITNGTGIVSNVATTTDTVDGSGIADVIRTVTPTEVNLSLASGAVAGTSGTGGTGATGSAGSGTAHAHDMDIRVRYADAIRATKN